MSKIEELLRKKREAQIRRMEGEPDADAEAKVDRELERLQKRSKKKKSKPKRLKNKKIDFTPHARQRMSQRGMKVKDVYAIWRAGQSHTQRDGRTVYTVTRTAIEAATAEDKKTLESWLGCAVIIEERTRSPVLITILAAGEDTRTYSAWRRRPNRRGRR